MKGNTRKERKKDERRTEIIRVAERLFYAKGFDNVTMDEIAEEVDLSKGTLYLHFKNKDSLFFAIVTKHHAQCLELLLERVKDRENGKEKLRAIIQWYVDIAKANPEYIEMASTYGPLIWSRMNTEDEVPMDENLLLYHEILNEAIAEGIKDGSIRDDLDPMMLGFYVSLISISVTSPLPAWKNGFELAGISFIEFLDNFSRFIVPSIERTPKQRSKNT
ncbi:MAG TPA: TetR/AcrR family transcriptional regulator [Methanospirillum sp.]|nr:TetR/AcrR family transcriptional regulator [Methanospirillum sp.]